MNHLLQTQRPGLWFLLIFFFLGWLLEAWLEAQARAEEDGAGYSSVNIKNGTISVSAKDVPLELLCKDIGNRSGIRFKIEDALLKNRVSIELKNLPLLKGVKRLLAHKNYMLSFDHQNKLSEVFIVGQTERHTPSVLRKLPPRRDVTRIRNLLNRPHP